MKRTPRWRAPFASASARSAGFTWPSVGRKAAPTTSLTSITGHNSRASPGESRCMSRPKLCAVVACLRISVSRSALQARRSPPFIFQPVAWPVSASSAAYNSTLYLSSCVMLADVRSWPTSPAACHVEPLVSLLRSSTTISLRPSFARWYAVLQPMMPPPMMTISAWEGMAGIESTLGQRHGQPRDFMLSFRRRREASDLRRTSLGPRVRGDDSIEISGVMNQTFG